MKTPYQDDSDLTEIIIQPDGRIYAFGLTPEVAAALVELDQKPVTGPVHLEKTQSHGTATDNVYNDRGGTHGEG